MAKVNKVSAGQLHTAMDDGASSIDTPPLTSSMPSSSSTSASFMTANGTVITAQKGSTASLPCEVSSLGDGVV